MGSVTESGSISGHALPDLMHCAWGSKGAQRGGAVQPRVAVLSSTLGSTGSPSVDTEHIPCMDMLVKELQDLQVEQLSWSSGLRSRGGVSKRRAAPPMRLSLRGGASRLQQRKGEKCFRGYRINHRTGRRY